MFEVVSPVNDLLQRHVQYIYKFSSDDPDFRRRLVIFPNTGSAIVFYRDINFVAEGYRHFLSFEQQGNRSMVLHLNRSEPISIQESGRQKRVGVVFKPLGVNQFLGHSPGLLLETNNPSLIPARYFDISFEEFSRELDMDQPLPAVAKYIEELLLKNYTAFTNALLERSIREITDDRELRSIEGVAQQAGAASKTINRLFHKYIGLSPVEFRKITQFRNALKTKLDNEGTSVTRIAFDNNYYDLAYMSKVFRQFTGINVREFFSSISFSGDGQYVYIG